MLSSFGLDALLRPNVLAWLFGGSLVTFVGSLALMPVLLARIRADYFVRSRQSDVTWMGRHPVIRISTRVIKNVVGGVLLLAGLAMMVLPGQGIITVLVALTLLDFPGKRHLELRIIGQRQVQQAVNWIRARAGQPPLILPDASNQS